MIVPIKFNLKIFTIMSLYYPITRSFSCRWLTPISLVGSIIVIAILSVVNSNHNLPTHFQSMAHFLSTAALAGYETITVFKDDFNATQTFWFDRFFPFYEQKPGTLCDSHVFNVGDPLTTNYSFFQWNVNSIIVQPNAGQSGILYSGTPLTFCDATTIFVDGSLISWSIDFTVISSCLHSNLFNATARTSFSMSLLPGRYSPYLGVRLLKMVAKIYEERFSMSCFFPILFYVFFVLNIISRLQSATQDVGNRVYNALLFSNQTSAISLSAQVDFNYCPMSFGLNASCAINPPQFNITLAAAVFPNSTVHKYNSRVPLDPV